MKIPSHLSTFKRFCDKSADPGSTLYQSFQEVTAGVMEGQKEGADPPLRHSTGHMSVTERLRKVIQELVDTEKSYVKDLSCLFEIYLKPLQNETFLSQDEMESLFGSLPEMLDFQKVFLQTLEEKIASSPDFSTLETPFQFKKLLFSLGGSFLYYADHFKLYSGFCANHIKVQKVLERAKTDRAFKEFLGARNPTKQHSSTLESYLIKPVQRVLKYPLLLRELVSLTDAESEEHYHLTEAFKAMEKVASHINEMQKIYEDYGTVFDQLVAEQSGSEKEVTEISMGEFLMHSSVIWLNPFPSLGRMRKDPEVTVFGTDTNCIWELIHTKSEIEGRPESVFQLCSSVPESKAQIIKVIRSILRENVRRHLRCEFPLEKICKERLVPLRNTMPLSARIGSSRASWLCKLPSSDEGTLKATLLDLYEGSHSSGTQSSDCRVAESMLDNHPPTSRDRESMLDSQILRPGEPEDNAVKESDILSDDDDYCETGKESPTKDIEVQFQRLKLSEDSSADRQLAPCVQPEAEELDVPEKHPMLVRGHYCPIKRKGNSLKRNKGVLLAMKEHSRSLDSQSEAASLDLNALLEREFSVQSLASVVNEDCFYETVPESKAQIIKVIRSILRENVRRHLRCEFPLEKICKERLVPLRNTMPLSARIGSSRASWLCKLPSSDEGTLKATLLDLYEGSHSSGTQSSDCRVAESMLDNHPPTSRDRESMLDSQILRPGEPEDNAVKESDILSDDDDYSETGKESPTKDIEVQFQRLKLSEDSSADRQLAPCVQPEAEELDVPEKHPMLVQGHYCPIKRKGNSLKRNKGVLLAMKEHSRSLDSQSEAASLDLNALLEREFSVQSLASVVNEDCFYETSDSDEKPVFPSL
ncbi:UNVERIFIED_CONTAM: hypothetical protein FKN15_059954 [Acipenser sinensis]